MGTGGGDRVCLPPGLQQESERAPRRLPHRFRAPGRGRGLSPVADCPPRRLPVAFFCTMAGRCHLRGDDTVPLPWWLDSARPQPAGDRSGPHRSPGLVSAHHRHPGGGSRSRRTAHPGNCRRGVAGSRWGGGDFSGWKGLGVRQVAPSLVRARGGVDLGIDTALDPPRSGEI